MIYRGEPYVATVGDEVDMPGQDPERAALPPHAHLHPRSQDPQGSQCLVDAFGDNPDRTVSWTSDCGQALARHLLASAEPALLLLGVTVAATARGLRRSRSRPAHTTAAAS